MGHDYKAGWNEFDTKAGSRVRIEAGLPFVETIATPEVLRDTVTHTDYKAGAPDARGKEIKMGAPFAYVDYFAEERHARGEREHPHNFKVYRLEDDETFTPDKIVAVVDGVAKVEPHTDHPLWKKRWMKHGEFETPEEAEAFAATL